MNPHEILIELWQAGILVRLAPDGVNLAVPAGRLTTVQRDLVLAHKPELIAFLADARITATALIEAAMKVCDRHGDGEVARQEMRQQCLELPPNLQADLLEHFKGKPVNLPNRLDKAGEKQ